MRNDNELEIALVAALADDAGAACQLCGRRTSSVPTPDSLVQALCEGHNILFVEIGRLAPRMVSLAEDGTAQQWQLTGSSSARMPQFSPNLP